jgi:TolA-binding protein
MHTPESDSSDSLRLHAQEVSIMAKALCLLMLVGFVAVMGCDQKSVDPTPGKVTSEDVRRDAGQAVNTAAEFSQQTKEEFQKNLDARLNSLDAEIAKLREKGRDLKDEAKVNFDRKMADLEAKRNTVRAKLAEVSRSSADAWKDVQKGAQSAWEDLEKAFRDASHEF